MKYRRKPIEVEAFQFGRGNRPQWFTDATKTGEVLLFEKGAYGPQTARINSSEGRMEAQEGEHWIVKSADGDIHALKNSVFDALYEPAEEAP